MKSLSFLFVLVLIFSSAYALTQEERAKLQQLQQQFEQEYQELQVQIAEYQQRTGQSRSIFRNGERLIISGFLNGIPIYEGVFNIDAAITTHTNELWPGGSTGLNLTGNLYDKIGVWDEGRVLCDHVEFTNNGTIATRINQNDNWPWVEVSDHATHVSGTICANGVNPLAQGMAYNAEVNAWDFDDDLSEMTGGVLDGLEVSNHSYGQITGWDYDVDDETWYWYGDTSVSNTEDYRFGFYSTAASQWDQLAYESPDYLIVKSAGNDRDDDPPNQPVNHYVMNSLGFWVQSNDVRNPDGGNDGYDTITSKGTAKNILTVGAIKAWNQGEGMTTFSNWGPCDDGRIKPDVVACGYQMNSCIADGQNAYALMSGTSMSAPNVTGSVALLQQFYQSLNNDVPMTANSMKNLVIHTTQEKGDAIGPDYRYGWGLADFEAAATVIEESFSNEQCIFDETLVNNTCQTFHLYSTGDGPIKVSIVWNDPPGPVADPALNPTQSMLVNDLDLVVHNEQGNEIAPWFLELSTPDLAAQRGDNDIDNVEVVFIDESVDPNVSYFGTHYIVTISHEGILVDDNGQVSSQDYSLIFTGASQTGVGDPVLYAGDTTPETGDPTTDYYFSVTYQDPGNREPESVVVYVDGSPITLSGTGNWSEGVVFESSSPSQFAEGSHQYYFESNTNGSSEIARYPAYGTLSFTVSPQPADGISLTFSETPFTVGQEVTIYATLNPPIENHPINFWHTPDNMGTLYGENPFNTNSNGVAQATYLPSSTGEVTIACVDANDTSTFDYSEVAILAPDHDYTFQTSATYYSGDNTTYSIYDLSIRVFDQGEPVDWQMPFTLTCEQGLFENNQHSQDHVTTTSGFIAGSAKLTFTENTTAIVNIDFDGGSHSFNFPVSVVVPEMTPVQSITIAQSHEYNTFDWGRDSKSIFYSTEQYKCKERDLIFEVDNTFMDFFNYNGDNSVVQMIRLSPDGSKILFSTSFDFYIFDVDTQNQLATNNDIAMHEGRGNMEWVTSNKFILADMSNDGTRLYTNNGSSLNYQQLRDASWDPYEADYSNNLIVVSYKEDSPHDGLVSVWNHSGTFLYDIDANPGYNEDTRGVSITDDGSVLAISDYRDEVIKIYNGSTYSGTNLSSGAWCEFKLDWQPGSTRYLLSLGHNKKICLWDVDNEIMIQTKQYTASYPMWQLNWSPNGKLFAIIVPDSNPRIDIFSPWDSEAPTVYIPSNNGTINLNESISSLSGTAYDENEIELLRYRFDTDPWTDLTITDNSFAIDVSTITEDCMLQILTKDDCLNAETYTYIIDVQGETVPPQISNVSVSDDNPLIGATILATATVIDDSSGVNPDSVFCIVQQPDGTAQFTLNMHDDGLNGDATAGDDIYSVQIDTATLSETTYYIDVKAEDNEGNMTYNNNATTFNPHDDTQIDITQIAPSTIYYTDDIEITAEITDQSGVLNAILYYNWGTTRTMRDIGVSMTSLGNDLFMATLPEQQHPVINYYIEVLDGAQNTTTSAMNTLAVNIPPKAPENLLINLTENQLVLSWDEVTEDIFNNTMNVAEYLVYSASNPEMSEAMLETTTESLTVTLPIAETDSMGYYEVIAESECVVEPPINFVMVPADSFRMGRVGVAEAEPVHTVILDAFFIGKYEVTQQEVIDVFNWANQQNYINCVDASVTNVDGEQHLLIDLESVDCAIDWDGSQLVFAANSIAPSPQCPCIEITWYGAVAFCNFLSIQQGLTPCYDFTDWSCNWNANGYRLPTEAEWEFAARGATNDPDHLYAGSDTVDDVAWYVNNSGGHTHPAVEDDLDPVSYPGGGQTFNMSGNVWEWCWDRYGSYSSDTQTNPTGPTTGNSRVKRGAYWNGSAIGCEVAFRQYSSSPTTSNSILGFRLCRNAE